jgi:hypothetical protein
MPTPTSYADIITSWLQLLEASSKTPELKSGIDEERAALEAALAEVQALKARQNELTAFRQEATQQLAAAVKRGQDRAIRFRSVARAKVGPYNERVVHFNVAPIRNRKRKAVVEVPPNGETPGGTPGTEPNVPPTT